jgi:hypothetical protein
LTDDTAALRVQVARQVWHWRAATVALQDPENFAAAAAWRSLERYLDISLRKHLGEAAERVEREADTLVADLRAASTVGELEAVRLSVIRFRRRYLQIETALEFYGNAVNTRTSARLAGLLTACDTMAVASMRQVLEPLNRPVPPILTYVDKGLGASILRAGLRLWDGGSVSPAAALKITRQNLYRPTALVHESGHQVAHILGWNHELAELLRRELAPASTEVADTWASWSSEIAADTHAFVHTGYGSVAALHDVVSGGPTVFRLVPGDPHPVAFLRVLLGVQMCVRCFGAGPWDELGRAWVRGYTLESAPPDTRMLAERSLPLLPRIVELCLLTPMRAFGGKPIVALVDPLRVHPDALEQLERDAGGALTTSSYWVRQEALRLLALTSYRSATQPEHSAEIAKQYESWMLRLATPLAVAA